MRELTSAYLGDMPLDEVKQLDIDDQQKACIMNSVDEKSLPMSRAI